MNDIISIQQAIFRGLQSCSLFSAFNIVLAREFLASAEVNLSAIWLTPGPTGKQGIGLLVQIPTVRWPNPNGLQRQRVFSVCVYEERNINFTAANGEFGGGTFQICEDVADQLLDFLWNWRLWRASGLIPETAAVAPDHSYPGIVGMKVSAYLRQEREQPARAATPVITVDANNNVTITVTDGSAIYYTMDGFSYPSPKTDGSLSGETAATLYGAPFSVAPGTTIMAAAFANGILPSQTSTLIVT